MDFSVSCNSLILFYTLLAFVCYWQFLKIRCEMEEESSRLSPMGNSDKWWRITIFWVIPLHHCKKNGLREKQKQKTPLYDENYPTMDFTHVDNPSHPSALCFVWGKQLTNAATAPAKWKSHLTINYSHVTQKGLNISNGYWNLKANRKSFIYKKKKNQWNSSGRKWWSRKLTAWKGQVPEIQKPPNYSV